MKVLVGTQGALAGNTYRIGGRTLIGRDGECDIQLVDRSASRRHACLLELDDGSVLLRDLKSQNGTLLGGEPVREATLKPGDVLTVGESSFEYRLADDDTELTDDLDADLRLVSGPAQDKTVVQYVSPEARAEIAAAAAARRRELAARKATGSSCCGSSLADRARVEGWPHCPACGQPVS
ncbi:MAG: FHA domain-containing protein [Myxococcales bacterium]|jgi:pSer/pThr/pTyr-binding forkhead associated (FHA) protein